MLQNSETTLTMHMERHKLENFDKKLNGTVYMRPRLNQVKWHVFFAKRSDPREKAMQDEQLMNFWQQFFYNANAIPVGWILMDG